MILNPRVIRTYSLFGLLVVISVGFDIASGGLFLSPHNLYNLVVQTSVVGIMATGMTIVIVSANIDLSVGSALGLVGMIIAVFQIELFPLTAGWNWPLSILIGLVCGALIGAWNGIWVAFGRVPSLVVTLGGLLIFRGFAYETAQGRTLSPFQPEYQIFGGGMHGALGVKGSWIVYIVSIMIYVVGEWVLHRRQIHMQLAGDSLRRRLIRTILVILIAAAFVQTMNAYYLPRTTIGQGVPIPALVLFVIVLIMEFIARFTTFGRYTYAIGGNTNASRLVGLPIRATLFWGFVMMGVLAAAAAIIQTARLNAGTSASGQFVELRVIAAVVVGGVSLLGGSGTVTGAVVGALVIQSLDTGLVLVGASSSSRQIATGLILTLAVFLNQMLSRERD